MAYKVEYRDVSAEVSHFSAPTLHYWRICLGFIAEDPHPRTGAYVERVLPISPLPTRNRVFEISEERSVSDEQLFVFIADFFRGIAIVYVIYEQRVYDEGSWHEGTVDIFSLRPY